MFVFSTRKVCFQILLLAAGVSISNAQAPDPVTECAKPDVICIAPTGGEDCWMHEVQNAWDIGQDAYLTDGNLNTEDRYDVAGNCPGFGNKILTTSQDGHRIYGEGMWNTTIEGDSSGTSQLVQIRHKNIELEDFTLTHTFQPIRLIGDGYDNVVLRRLRMKDNAGNESLFFQSSQLIGNLGPNILVVASIFDGTKVAIHFESFNEAQDVTADTKYPMALNCLFTNVRDPNAVDGGIVLDGPQVWGTSTYLHEFDGCIMTNSDGSFTLDDIIGMGGGGNALASAVDNPYIPKNTIEWNLDSGFTLANPPNGGEPIGVNNREVAPMLTPIFFRPLPGSPAINPDGTWIGPCPPYGDHDGDGVVTSVDEFEFSNWLNQPPPSIPKRVLSAFDSNGDGAIDSLDETVFEQALNGVPVIPTIGEWGLFSLALGLVGAGTIILRSKRSDLPRRFVTPGTWYCILFVTPFLAQCAYAVPDPAVECAKPNVTCIAPSGGNNCWLYDAQDAWDIGQEVFLTDGDLNTEEHYDLANFCSTEPPRIVFLTSKHDGHKLYGESMWSTTIEGDSSNPFMQASHQNLTIEDLAIIHTFQPIRVKNNYNNSSLRRVRMEDNAGFEHLFFQKSDLVGNTSANILFYDSIIKGGQLAMHFDDKGEPETVNSNTMYAGAENTLFHGITAADGVGLIVDAPHDRTNDVFLSYFNNCIMQNSDNNWTIQHLLNLGGGGSGNRHSSINIDNFIPKNMIEWNTTSGYTLVNPPNDLPPIGINNREVDPKLSPKYFRPLPGSPAINPDGTWIGPCPPYGDYNGDGVVTTVDEIEFNNWLNQPPPSIPTKILSVFDSNDDGAVDSLDEIVFEQALNGIPVIPTIGEWGLVLLIFGLVGAGTIILRSKRNDLPGRSSTSRSRHCILLATPFLTQFAYAGSDVETLENNNQHVETSFLSLPSPEFLNKNIDEIIAGNIKAEQRLVSEIRDQGSNVQESGTSEVIFLDYPNGKSETRYFLNRESQKYALHFISEKPRMVSGKQIAVEGQIFGSDILVDVLDIADDNSRIGVNPNLGEQRTVVILVNAQDNPLEPITLQQASDKVFDSTDFSSVTSYIETVSYNKAFLTGDVFGWYTLSQTETQLCDISNNFIQIRDAAIVAADPDVFFPNYSRIIIAYPNPTFPPGCLPYALASVGQIPLTTQDGQVTASTIVMNGASFMEFIVPHEFGHNFGTFHANGWECNSSTTIGAGCSSLEAFDLFDVMGQFFDKKGHFNSFHMETIGWFDPENILNTNDWGIYQIEPIETPGSGIKHLKLQGANWNYSIEYRRNLGYDTINFDFFAIPDLFDGTMIHTDLFVGIEGGDTQLLDNQPVDSQPLDWDETVLKVGQTFQDPESNVSITTLSVNANFLEVEIGDCSLPPLEWGQPDCQPNGIADSCDIRNSTSFDNNSNDIPDECEVGVAIPTTSQWGILIMTQLVLILGTIIMRGRS